MRAAKGMNGSSFVGFFDFFTMDAAEI